MDNKSISDTLKLLADLKELHDEDPFRISSVRNAGRKISKMGVSLQGLNLVQLQEMEGVGKSVAKSIFELNEKGTLKELETLKEGVPVGIIQMLSIPGLGAKKIQIIWKVLGIETIGELRYACNENRLIEAKGFGIKTQNDILNVLDFFEENQGLFLYPKLLNQAKFWIETLKKAPFVKEILLVGDLRRNLEYSDRIEILISTTYSSPDLNLAILAWIKANESENPGLNLVLFSEPGLASENQGSLSEFNWTTPQGIKVFIYVVRADHKVYQEFLLTGSPLYIKSLGTSLSQLESPYVFESEKEIYDRFGKEYIEPELREDWSPIFSDLLDIPPLKISEDLKKDFFPRIDNSHSLIAYSDLKGALHNHSTYSDGINSLEEMVQACIELNLSYFGICDHSKTAVYANGLSIERLMAQSEEIDRLNLKYAPFRIFKGIESDILNDGSLDYPEEVLKNLDFVVASVHSNLKMDKQKAMQRLLTAIENPYTTILGHPTGRLLLGRSGYPLDMEEIIHSCIKNQVIIEINANPNRLDIDWRWVYYGLNKGATFSINPDAHKREGLMDMKYGIGVSRKAGLYPEKCLNTFSLEEIQTYFQLRKKQKLG